MHSTQQPRRIHQTGNHPESVLFLGYDENETQLIETVGQKGYAVWHTAAPVQDLSAFNTVISYGYQHLLAPEVIRSARKPVLNLHIAYLPFNRGAHPNFWSFYEGTPSGVTIHEVDEGVDTGPIVLQKYVNFEASENTFSHTYARLRSEIEALFLTHINELLTHDYQAKPQRHKGTFHKKSDLPQAFEGWDSVIDQEVSRLEQLQRAQTVDKLKLIDEIEKVRTANNVNWMDLLRLAFRAAPDEAKLLVQRINSDDRRISDLFSELGK